MGRLTILSSTIQIDLVQRCFGQCLINLNIAIIEYNYCSDEVQVMLLLTISGLPIKIAINQT